MGSRQVHGFFTNKRQQKLFTRTYHTPAQPKAVLVWSHGYGEHSGRYEKVHHGWAQDGIEIHTWDVFSHGQSEPFEADSRAFIPDYQHLVDDMLAYVTELQARNPSQPPLFVGGQSMGGEISLLAALAEPKRFSGLVLASAAVDVERTLPMKLQEPVGSLLSWLVPRAQIVPAIALSSLSNDKQVISDFMQDPLNFHGVMRVRTAVELAKGFVAIRNARHSLKMPVYAHHGTADAITSPKAAEELMQAIPAVDKTFTKVPGGLHELLMGSEADQYAKPIAAWILERSQGTAGQRPKL